MPERAVPTPDVLQPPPACARCGNPDQLFTPNATRDPSAPRPLYEPAWQCPRCGALAFLARADEPASVLNDFLQPVQVDDAGRLWLAPNCADWGPIVRRHHLTVVFDLEQDLDHGIPAHPDHVIYVFFPFQDEGLPTLHKLHGLARLGAHLMREGERVLVHCEMGLNRSALLAGLMLVYGGTPGEDAVRILQDRRPGALYNDVFAEHLRTQPAGGSEAF
jgi:hypothetical protein